MRPKRRITALELLNLVPANLLKSVAADTQVDYSVSKLTGQNMFALLLYGLMSEKEVSLKILTDVFHSPLLQALNQKKKITKGAIGHRLHKMNPDFFKQIFDHLVEDERVNQYMGVVEHKYVLKKVDSTIVTLSAKLLNIGLKINDTTRDLKFSVGLLNTLPAEIKLFTAQTYASEEKALPEIFNQKRALQSSKTTILLFDRGVQSRDTLENIRKQKNTFFVTRLGSQGYQVDRVHKQVRGRKAGKLVLVSDEVIHFESQKEKRVGEFRLVKAHDPETNEVYQFLTDIFFLNEREVCELYKSRWEIETFFKFIKQQLNFSHLVSRSENGIKIMMYMTMITAILIALYKKINQVDTWGSAKRRFFYEVEVYVLETFFPYYASRWGYEKKISLTYDSC